MNKIKTTTLGELIEFQRGYDLPKSEFKNGTIPVISSNGILGYHNEYKVKGPGITIGRSGTVGLPHYINENFFPHNTSLFIKDFKNNNPKYIFYLLKTLGLNDFKSGSGVPTMNRNHLHPIGVNAFLDITEQQKIASVLSSLDSKIELNNRINAGLEAMAKTLYDYWFVQFDFPNAQGKPYKTSGGAMVWNEELKREIPEGWNSGQVGNIGKVSMCKRVMKHETFDEEEIPFFKISTFGSEADTFITRDLFELYLKKYPYPKRGDILISAAGTIGKTVIFDGKPSYFQDSNIVWIDNDESKVSNCYLYYYYQTEPWVATGGSTIKRLYNDNIRNLRICFPSKNILKRYSLIVNSLLDKQHQIVKENQKLTELRDWLLPMLMNGQVKVGDGQMETVA